MAIRSKIMNRMTWPVSLVAHWALLLGLVTADYAPAQATIELLPAPVAAQSSVEMCLNSRYSMHDLGGTADLQQISQVLWAAGASSWPQGFRTIILRKLS